MTTEQAKPYHHHTPRQYLLSWADADERIGWYGYGKVSRSGLTVVGGENDFYQLRELPAASLPGQSRRGSIVSLGALGGGLRK